MSTRVRMSRGPRRQAGFALLIVLWSVVLLALLGTQITSAGRSQLQLAANVREAAAAQAAADAGVFRGVFHVLDAAARWPADNAPHTEQMGRFALTIQVADENGKVNPNIAPQDLLAALVIASGADAGTARLVANAIVDWRFPGGSAQKLQSYRSAGRAVGPDGLPFRSVRDLGLVLGVTPELLARMTPFFSVYADGDLNYAHADPPLQAVLRAIAGRPPAPAAPAPPTVVTITATASDARGGRFARRATVSFGKDAAGRLFRVLTWQAV